MGISKGNVTFHYMTIVWERVSVHMSKVQAESCVYVTFSFYIQVSVFSYILEKQIIIPISDSSSLSVHAILHDFVIS